MDDLYANTEDLSSVVDQNSDLSNNDDPQDADILEEDLSADKFKNVAISGTDWTIETIVSQIRKKNIILSPKFQRRNVWNNKDKTEFIESILLNIPIPNILLGEDINNKGKFLVIDGKQRLLTLAEFYGVQLDDETPSRKRFSKLQNPQILTELKGLTYADFETRGMKEKDLLDNYTIRTNLLRNIPNAKYLYLVFTRINTGSEPLSPQELRQSIYPGPFMDYISSYSDTTEINNLLNLDGLLHSRMKDTELLLRCYSFKFRFTKYNNSISNFLDGTVEEFNNSWKVRQSDLTIYYNEILNAIHFANKAFGDESFSLIGLGREKIIFNRPVFDLMIYFFTNPNTRQLIEHSTKKLIDEFKKLVENEVFAYALTTNTHQTLHTRVRFRIFYNMLRDAYQISSDSVLESVNFDEIKRLEKLIVESKKM